MQIDLWQRRAGWLGLVAVILFSGVVAQTRLLAADDADDQPSAAPKEAEQKIKGALEKMRAAEVQEKARAKMEKAQQEMERAKVLYDKQLWQYRASPFEQSGKYWIGVECRDASPKLRAQLGLKDDEGLVVMHVAEDSPAAKAGLKQH